MNKIKTKHLFRIHDKELKEKNKNIQAKKGNDQTFHLAKKIFLKCFVFSDI